MYLLPGKMLGVWLLLCCLGLQTLCSQTKNLSWQQSIDDYLLNNLPKKADSTAKAQLSLFLEQGQTDSLYQFPGKIGRIANLRSGPNQAAKKAEAFISFLKTKTNNDRTIYKAYLDLDNLYVFLGDDQNALKSSLLALESAKKVRDITSEEIGKINYAVGGNYYALYDLSNALVYFKDSAVAYERSDTIGKEILADAYNGIATAMWTLNKLDSAQIYYNKAISATKESNLKGFDLTYYIVAFQFNLALVKDAQGKLGEAIAMKEEIIPQLQKIISNSKDDLLVKKAKRLLASAVSNLAAFYNDTGYLSKAYEMLQFSYEKKKEVYEISSPRLATSLTQIALMEFELKEFEKSIATAELALENLKKSPSSYLAVEADIYSMLGKSNAALDRKEKASAYFKMAHQLYTEAYPKELSQEYLIFLRDYTQFLANNGEYDRALELAQNSYNYVKKTGGDSNFPILKEISNISDIYFKKGDFNQAHFWAQQGSSYLDKKLSTAVSDIDSVQIEFRRPAITLLEVRSLLKLNRETEPGFLLAQIEKIEKAVSSLEKRKTTTFSLNDRNSIMAEYKALSTESKKLYFDLYQRTGDRSYLNKTIGVHESGIYDRIRTQFNIKNDLRFGNLPDSIIQMELELKRAISSALTGTETNRLNTYFEATNHWKSFLEMLKKQYPKYFAMRYESIEEDLGDIQQLIPENITVVRYLFIEDDLFVFVVNQKTAEIKALRYDQEKELLAVLAEDQSNFNQTATGLKVLYDCLWQPISDLITTEKIVIIPDRELFNLSFETLTPSKISSFKELATSSLLAKNIISYNYSLLLLKQPAPTINYPKNFIAFAPEFNEEMKVKYQFSITDSLEIDKTYIKLLPQPFSTALVKEYSNFFNGTSFLNENSTKQVFKRNAKEHKIIHIGTHAESNNLTPEFSRLIFAKDISATDGIENNSLFTYEIYDYNLASNLTILTACETGKPSFDPGEGMISLAHAFNYAGSESMLTSLWKIDEKSSNEIIGYFYQNLSDGMAKDEALRQAKLSYLAEAEGRTIEPQYWAGLVLMGDTQPIELNSNFPFWPWFIGGLVVLAFIFIAFRKWNT